MARRQNGNGKLDKLDEAMTALVQAMASMQQGTAGMQQVIASMQQTTATLVQNQALAERRYQELKDTLEKRMERIEAFLVKMSAEMPERVFGFAQAQKKPSSGPSP